MTTSLNTQFDQLIDFPADIKFKVIGDSNEVLEQQVIAVAQAFRQGSYHTHKKPSTKGNYLSISITICVQNKAEMEYLYLQFNQIPGVRHIL